MDSVGVADVVAMGRSKEDEPMASTYVIPPYIIAEAMQSLHGSLDLRWSGPITPAEMRYVEQYLQTRYPEYYGGTIDKDNLPAGFFCTEQGESPEHGSDSVTLKLRDKSASVREYAQSFVNDSSELRKVQLEESSRLQEMLMKRIHMPETSISVPELHARNRALKHCCTTDEDYVVVFATELKEAMMLIGESYPFRRFNFYMSAFDEESDYIRQFAIHKESKFIHIPISWLDLRIAGSNLSQSLRRKSKHTPKGLFAYPLGINGSRNTLHWVSEAQRNMWLVLLDCTEFVLGDETINLTLYKPDFVLCTLYKGADHTTKISCILVRKNTVYTDLHK